MNIGDRVKLLINDFADTGLPAGSLGTVIDFFPLRDGQLVVAQFDADGEGEETLLSETEVEVVQEASA